MEVLWVASCGRGDAAAGVGAADEFYFGHDSCARYAGGFEEKPGDCGWVGRGGFLEEFAFDGTAVFGFPDGAGAVGSDVGAGTVDERCFRGLKDPLWTGGGLLAGIDLHTFAGSGEDGLLRGRRIGWRLGG